MPKNDYTGYSTVRIKMQLILRPDNVKAIVINRNLEACVSEP